jgi:GNAT superfamily N-acetyltransferase
MKENMINIRPATRDDTAIIRSLIHDLAVYERLEDEMIATEDDLQKTIFEQRCAEVFIAEWDGKAVGFSLFFQNYSTFLGKPGIYLEDLFVKDDFRGLGIGRALLINLARIAKQRGCRRFEWSVLDWNTSAIEFYKSLGAEMMDGWTGCRLSAKGIENLSKM